MAIDSSSFSIALRREWKQKGIGVTYAAPRATQTDAAVAFADLIAKTKMKLDPPDQVARQILEHLGLPSRAPPRGRPVHNRPVVDTTDGADAPYLDD